ncbi:hypothetical protein [Pleionea litopenaei]|uniref:Uncharacterized protein n=1 Tax=Pleionea litopenaei TaxID=3070815 RepID=A0AA51X5G4_9GAMM|nr:hypothetical protein [Pleionea sp. HL-JVS1]WMS86062.1 hypothetical protein Q9312_12625 [Pleionea sp. HL-JVS1]
MKALIIIVSTILLMTGIFLLPNSEKTACTTHPISHQGDYAFEYHQCTDDNRYALILKSSNTQVTLYQSTQPISNFSEIATWVNPTQLSIDNTQLVRSDMAAPRVSQFEQVSITYSN